MISGDAPMNTATEEKLVAAAMDSIRNSGWRSAFSELDSTLLILNGTRAPTGWVSGKRHQAANENARPQSTMNANTARQPKASFAQPPTMGATAGARLKIMVVMLIRCWARGPSY